MRVAWVHPTWRELVIERLAGDTELRRRFLARCGPHGIVLALSTSGGAEGERRLPLICDDEDWDAVGDRIYTLVPELEHPEVVGVLSGVRQALQAVGDQSELRALARMTLERLGPLWERGHAALPLSSIDAWLSLSARLDPRPWPGFLAATWAELLPSAAPDPSDLEAVQRLTDWLTLCELLGDFSPVALDTFGFGADHEMLIRDFLGRVGTGAHGNATEPVTRALEGVYRIMPELTPLPRAVGGAMWSPAAIPGPFDDDPPPLWEEDRMRGIADKTVRRVLADL